MQRGDGTPYAAHCFKVTWKWPVTSGVSWPVEVISSLDHQGYLWEEIQTTESWKHWVCKILGCPKTSKDQDVLPFSEMTKQPSNSWVAVTLTFQIVFWSCGVSVVCRKPSMGTWKLLQSLQILAMLEWLGLRWQGWTSWEFKFNDNKHRQHPRNLGCGYTHITDLENTFFFLDVGKQTAGFSMSWKRRNVVLATSWSIQVGMLQWEHVGWPGICERIL